MAHDLSAMQIEKFGFGDLTESRASSAQSLRILQCVICVLKSPNTLWLLGAPFKMHFEGILTDIIQTVLQCGVYPNRNCGKSTLWIFFPFRLSRRTNPHALATWCAQAYKGVSASRYLAQSRHERCSC